MDEERIPPRSNIGTRMGLVVLGIATLCASGPAISWQRPPEFQTSWLVSGGLSTLTILAALAHSRMDARLASRVCSGFALALGILSLSIPTLSYFQSYGDFPWVFTGPILLTAIAGGVLYGQRMVALATAGFVLFGLQGAFLSPQSELPITVKDGDYSLTIQSSSFDRRDTYDFVLTGPEGVDLRRAVNTERIESEANLGPLVPIEIFAHPNYSMGHLINPTSKIQASVRTDVPSWARTLNLAITFFEWPKEPAAFVDIPLDVDPKKVFEASGKGVQLKVTGARKTTTRHNFPAEPCISMIVSYSGYSYSGCTSTEFKLTDDKGDPLNSGGGGCWGTDPWSSEDVEIYPIPKRSRFIRVSLYSERQLEASKRSFRFNRLPAQR